MAAGKHHTGLAGQHIGGVVQRWSRDQADVADLATGVDQALDQLLDQHRSGQAAIATNRDLRLALGEGLGADGTADPIGSLAGQCFADNATDVVGTEDALGQCGYQVGHVVHLWVLQ